VTVDEELNVLDQQLRRLKIEYEIFFNNPTKRPPTDVEWKVTSLIRKFSDSPRMSFAQRYRYNEMAQRYAIQSDLWRKKMRIREEGYRRPADAILSVQGVRASQHEKVESLYKALSEAKKKSGEKVSGNLDSFAAFVAKKTSELRKQHGCDAVEYSVEMQGGLVKLKAKAKS
jgi:hypothetical protein